MIPKVINICTFDELSQTAKDEAISTYRDSGMLDNSFIYDEAHNSVTAFNGLFGTKEGGRSWLDIRTSHIDDNICQLKGLRLRTYIINNFGSELYKGKYYSLWSKIDFPFNKNFNANRAALKQRHSKVMLEHNCVLTGVCYDDSILQPIYDIIHSYSEDKHAHVTFEMLMNDCIQTLEKDLQTEEDYRNSDENIISEIEANAYTFTEDGEIEHA